MKSTSRSHKKLKSANHKRSKGIAILWTAMSLLILLLFMGLAIDGGVIYFAENQLQIAADAAALAGARIVRTEGWPFPEIRNQTYDFGWYNYVLGDRVELDLNTLNDPLGDIVIGRYYPGAGVNGKGLFVPTSDDGYPRPNAVMAVAENDAIPLHFGPIINLNTAHRRQVAIAQGLGGLGAGLLVLSEDPEDAPSLEFNGNPEVEIKSDSEDYASSIQVNMIRPYPPIGLGGSQVIVHADEFNAVSYDSTDEYIFDQVTGLKVTPFQPKVPDPYQNLQAPLPIPSTPQATETITVTGDDTPPPFEPGYYPYGFEIHGGTSVFKPGVYMIGGGDNGKDGLIITGGNVCARGVMFYITKNDDGYYGNVKITGASPSTNIVITEIKSEYAELQTDCDGNDITYSQGDSYVEPYKGMAIFQDRTNTNNAEISGGHEVDIRGTIYFPNNHLDLGGTPTSLGIQVIAHTLTIHGTGTAHKLIISYDGRNRIPANKAFLVE